LNSNKKAKNGSFQKERKTEKPLIAAELGYIQMNESRKLTCSGSNAWSHKPFAASAELSGCGGSIEGGWGLSTVGEAFLVRRFLENGRAKRCKYNGIFGGRSATGITGRIVGRGWLGRSG
jgi:hypothetical protein